MSGALNVHKGAAEQRAVASWYRQAGYTVIWFSQPGLPRGKRGRRGTFQTPGWPDLVIIDREAEPAELWAHEVKAGGARLSAVQRGVITLLERCGIRTVVGDAETAKAELRRRGRLVVRRGVEVIVHA
jgi:hypothetical protein